MDTAIIIKEVTDESFFDPKTISPRAPLTQAFFYGEWQKNIGRKVSRFTIEEDGRVVGMFQIINFLLPLNRTCLYIPYGPVLSCPISPRVYDELNTFLKRLGIREGAMFVRLDFTTAQGCTVDATLCKKYFHTPSKATYHSAFCQPRHEWQLNLSASEEELLQGFHKNTRYSIRVAEKNNVETKIIEENLSSHFDTFCSVLKETASRDNFHLHPKKYYEEILKRCDRDKNAVLIFSSYKNEVLAGNLVVMYGDTALFMFGGTRSVHREVLPAYAAQWATMRYLKQKGYSWYNFGGVQADEGKGSAAEKSWKGLTSFKKRFGGELLTHSNFYDVVTEPIWYSLYELYKKFRP